MNKKHNGLKEGIIEDAKLVTIGDDGKEKIIPIEIQEVNLSDLQISDWPEDEEVALLSDELKEVTVEHEDREVETLLSTGEHDIDENE